MEESGLRTAFQIFKWIAQWLQREADITIVTNPELKKQVEGKGGHAVCLPDKLPDAPRFLRCRWRVRFQWPLFVPLAMSPMRSFFRRAAYPPRSDVFTQPESFGEKSKWTNCQKMFGCLVLSLTGNFGDFLYPRT